MITMLIGELAEREAQEDQRRTTEAQRFQDQVRARREARATALRRAPLDAEAKRARTARTVAANIAEKYGVKKLALLVQLFENRRSFREIGEIFGVSGTRAQEWARDLGTRGHVYVVHADVLEVAREPILKDAGGGAARGG